MIEITAQEAEAIKRVGCFGHVPTMLLPEQAAYIGVMLTRVTDEAVPGRLVILDKLRIGMDRHATGVIADDMLGLFGHRAPPLMPTVPMATGGSGK